MRIESPFFFRGVFTARSCLHEFGQAANGGAVYVESGSFAAFTVPLVFANNSVSAGYAGGAVYASGQVRLPL